jgi:hypothetical protein
VDTITIVVLAVVIALLTGALAWYGPRRRHWQTHTPDKETAEDSRTTEHDSPDRGG